MKGFLDNQKGYWIAKQKEVEDRFIEVDKEGQGPDQLAPKSKRRKEVTKGVKKKQIDPYARIAAELQIFYFKKVSYI